MDIDMGELFFESFLNGIVTVLAGVWSALVANPWLFILSGAIIIGGIVLRSRPRRRRRY